MTQASNKQGKVKDMTSEERHLLSPQDRKAVIPAVDLFNNAVLTSAHTQRSSSVILGGKEIGFEQVVVAVGPIAQVKVGDWVHINVDMFPKTQKAGKHDKGNVITVHPPLEKIGGTDYLFISDRHVKWRIQEKVIKKVLL